MSLRLPTADVRYWHKADMPSSLHMSAFEGKADIEKQFRRFAFRLYLIVL